MDTTITGNSIFGIYPRSKDFPRRNQKEFLEKELEKLKEKQKPELLEIILQKIIEQFDQTKNAWTKAEYAYVRTQLTYLKPSEHDYMLPILLQLFDAKKEQVQEDLEILAENTSFYPEVSRTKTESGYRIQELPIQDFDIYKNLFNLNKKLNGSIYLHAEELIEGKDSDEVLQSLKDILEHQEEKRIQELFEPFEESFGFLKTTNFFHLLYEEYQEHYIEYLLHHVCKCANHKKYQEIGNVYYSKAGLNKYKTI